MEFYEVEPSKENYWRAIILFGANVASYKFALAKSLYDLRSAQNDLITLQELAVPFSKHLCDHLKHSPKQITSSSSKFLDACRKFNDDELSQDDLTKTTVQLGFNNVIDAFHIVNRSLINKKFFIDERSTHNGIRLTDDFFSLTEDPTFTGDLSQETEARWRLVETAWDLGISKNLIKVEYDQDLEGLFTISKDRRIDITSCRGGLNGYQKGKCFYCHRQISIESNAEDTTHVDHFFPWSRREFISHVNGVWNLVLACSDCNSRKSAQIPSIKWLKRLHKRNEYFITSHHPLRETIIQQTGNTEEKRGKFLQATFNNWNVTEGWDPTLQGSDIF